MCVLLTDIFFNACKILDFFLALFYHCAVLICQELQEQVAEQRRLLQSVANVGEELLSQQTTPNGDRYSTNMLGNPVISGKCNHP